MNGPVARFGAEVDLSGDQVLADAALAGDQHLGVARRRPPRDGEDFEHRRAGGDDQRRAAGDRSFRLGAFGL